jgi:deoxyribonuclease I
MAHIQFFTLTGLIACASLLGCQAPETGTTLPDSGSSKPGGGGASGAGACLSYDSVSDDSLVFYLHELMQTAYRPIEVELDQGGTANRYATARKLMFTEIERKRGERNQMVVECVFTGRTAPQPSSEEPDRDEMICERLWPKAQLFEDRSSPLFSHQDADLHHLYPTVPGAESLRGDLNFGDVADERNMDYAPAYRGVNRSGDDVFEVRRDRQGDVARAFFYMSVRWGLEIPKEYADGLRRWHELDPVSELETLRNTEVQRIQGNRNPFVDCPDLASRIRAFGSFRPYDLNGNLPNP